MSRSNLPIDGKFVTMGVPVTLLLFCMRGVEGGNWMVPVFICGKITLYGWVYLGLTTVYNSLRPPLTRFHRFLRSEADLAGILSEKKHEIASYIQIDDHLDSPMRPGHHLIGMLSAPWKDSIVAAARDKTYI